MYATKTPVFEHPYVHPILPDEKTAAQSLIGNFGPTPLLISPDSEEIRFLLWALVVALACCLYAPELDIQ